MIEIPRNTFEVPTECREVVVGAICQILLEERIYHTSSWTACRRGYNGVRQQADGSWYFDDIFYKEEETDKVMRFRGCEMKEAFRILISSGYHIFRIYEYGNWPGYKLYRTPYIPNGSCYYDGSREVLSFEENIDY